MPSRFFFSTFFALPLASSSSAVGAAIHTQHKEKRTWEIEEGTCQGDSNGNLCCGKSRRRFCRRWVAAVVFPHWWSSKMRIRTGVECPHSKLTLDIFLLIFNLCVQLESKWKSEKFIPRHFQERFIELILRKIVRFRRRPISIIPCDSKTRRWDMSECWEYFPLSTTMSVVYICHRDKLCARVAVNRSQFNHQKWNDGGWKGKLRGKMRASWQIIKSPLNELFPTRIEVDFTTLQHDN